MNIVNAWIINFLNTHYIVQVDRVTTPNKEYLCARLVTDLTYYAIDSEITYKPITKRNVNDFCGREKYFRKCLKEAHGIEIKILDDGRYAFKSITDMRTFIRVMYLFFMVRDTDGFIYRTEKGVIEYDK